MTSVRRALVVRSAHSIASAVLAVSLAQAPAARADTYDAALARAVSAKERALEANDPPHWDDALRLFTEADAIRSTRESKYELAFAAAKMHQNDIAVEAYQAALDLGLVGTARATAEAFVSQNAGSMARVEVVGPPGATVYVAERFRGRIPLSRPLVVFAGLVRVHIALATGERIIEDVQVPAGTLRLLRVSPSAGSPPTSAPARSAPPPSSPPAASEPASESSSQRAASGNTLGWTLLAGGAAAIAGGAVLLPVASSKIDSHRDDLRATCAVLQGDDECANAKPGEQTPAQTAVDGIATWKAVRTGAVIGLGAGIASAAIGVVALATQSGTSTHSHTDVVPVYGGAIVVYAGRF